CPCHVYDYSWVVGLVAAFLCYLVLSAVFPAGAVSRRPQAAAAAAATYPWRTNVIGAPTSRPGLQPFRRSMARLSFGVCFAPDPPPSRWVDLTKLAEAQGFDYAWLFDSHVLWQEVYPIFTLMAANTRRIKIGPCVTNPATR